MSLIEQALIQWKSQARAYAKQLLLMALTNEKLLESNLQLEQALFDNRISGFTEGVLRLTQEAHQASLYALELVHLDLLTAFGKAEAKEIREELSAEIGRPVEGPKGSYGV